MISDKETNTIYFSDNLFSDSKYQKLAEQINSVFKSIGLIYNSLSNTNDIWARDYMPIQITDTVYVEYCYDPDYLQGKWKDFRGAKTYPGLVCDSLDLKTIKSDIIMDGGNFVKSSDCIILTDKIVKENSCKYSKKDLLKKLEETFKVSKVVLIPWDVKDKYGHSDGVLRFIDNETVLINSIYQKDSVLLYRLKNNGIKYQFLEFDIKRKDKRNWAYINFLQTRDFIFLPTLEIEEDELALTQIKAFYPEYRDKIIQIKVSEIVQEGGALNCISWTTKE